jgi:acyl-CoA thioesterase-1
MLRLLLTMILICSSATAAEQKKTILVFGDSLSAGYGIGVNQGWVALLQRRLATQGYGYRVVNASISGETTSGGSERVRRALELNKPALVILELGANDGLRGLPVDTTRSKLEFMIDAIRKQGAQPLLVGVQLPPNYGARFTDQHSKMFQDIATKNKIAFAPALMANIGLNPTLMQDDGLHPNVAGQPLMLDNVWSHLEPMLHKP